MATATKTASAVPEINSTEDLEEFINVIADGLMKESDLLANVAISLHPKLVRRLKAAGLDQARLGGLLGGSASQAAKSVTRQFKFAAELEEQAARAMKTAWLNYLRNIVEPILAAQTSRQEFKV